MVNQRRTDLYIEREGRKTEKRTAGKGVTWAESWPNKRLKQFDVRLSAGEEVVFYQRNLYNHVLDNSTVGLEVATSENAFSNWEAAYEELLRSQTNFSFMSGFSLLAAILSFFFFIVVRERLYLYFSSFVFLIALMTFFTSYNDVFIKAYPVQTAYTLQTLIFPIVFLALRFIFLFNQTEFYFPRWHKVNYAASYGLLVVTLALFLPAEYENSPIAQAASLTCIIVIVSSVLLTVCSIIRNKQRWVFHALTIGPILIVFIAAISLALLLKETQLIRNYLPEMFVGAYYWLLIAFSWDLILRFRRLIKKNEVEKLALIEQQKTELEDQVKARTLELNQSLNRSDSLLLNILPEDVAEELKEKGSAKARLFDEVTVLFTDFVNFTSISERLTPQELVDELHHCFEAFDHIISKYGIEKIKTIGDAYLAVSGLPNPEPEHARNIIYAALEIRDFVEERKKTMGDKTFAIRIGVHSGSVVAGIVGIKKFAYDIWGDTVNTAARMEQSSEQGKINVSEKTYNLVSDQFDFWYRGEIEAKNKGTLKMYFADRRVDSLV